MPKIQKSPMSAFAVRFCSCYGRRRNKNRKYSMSLTTKSNLISFMDGSKIRGITSTDCKAMK